MPADQHFEEGLLGYGFDQVRLIPERIEQGFQRLNRPLSHTLRIASDTRPMLGAALHARVVPCAWGVRWDEYCGEEPGGGRGEAAFRSAAAEAAMFLLRHPLAVWSNLLPGTMTDVMARQSKLYMADYWTLVLHHLVWSKKLPYTIRAQWIEGDGTDDDPFYFVSELPVSLAEASLDALILFQEEAVKSLEHRFELAHATPISGPPIRRNGRWRSPRQDPEKPIKPDAPISAAEPLDADDESEKTGHETNAAADLQPPAVELDDQTFTVCSGDATYRFTGRNKQLFALLERISRRPGLRIVFDELRAVGDVWDGSPVEDSTIRGAVTRLRKTLKNHGLTGLANRVTTGTYQGRGYVMLGVEADAE